ncbi:MAG: DUF1295 domain-containing protein [Acidobacteria bacterium]|nr:MAG: DUF1295 domain-containing protein [Acidobacteriota bacterium]REK03303.1 MAG: DUF1295 domain-containing protein [Acidobacteriota bacterium]
MRLKIPPAILGLVFLLAMVALAQLLPGWRMGLGPVLRGAVAVVLATASTWVAVAAILQFQRERTTVDPLHPDRASMLVTWGIFAWSRNPMYLGFVGTLLAVAVWLDQLLAVLLAVVFALVLQKLQIEPEERLLEERFGETYREYRRRVRRWL